MKFFNKKKKIAEEESEIIDIRMQSSREKHSALNAYPLPPYETKLKDLNGEEINLDWIDKLLDSAKGSNEHKDGQYLDRNIVEAMRRSLADLAKQRGGAKMHVSADAALESQEASDALGAINIMNESLESLKRAHDNAAMVMAWKF